MSEFDPPKGVLGSGTKWLLIGVVLITLGYFFLLPLLAGGRVVDRAVKNYDTETSAQVQDNSRIYQQGTNLSVARYCREWAKADDPAAKKAVADLIANTLATYQGPLTALNEQCATQVGAR